MELVSFEDAKIDIVSNLRDYKLLENVSPANYNSKTINPIVSGGSVLISS